MMKVPVETIAHRELRNRSAEILRRVHQGATFRVTNRGEVVAVIGPVASGVDVRVRPARHAGGFASLRRARIDRPTQEHLDDLRGER